MTNETALTTLYTVDIINLKMSFDKHLLVVIDWRFYYFFIPLLVYAGHYF